MRTLEKIKLLRWLSLDLEAIRRLQAGELSLSRALAGQALALEGDRDDLERYAQVCEELSRTETSYDDLDPEPWLAALEEKSLPLSRRVDPAEQDSIAAAPYPWRRYFARALDLSLAGILWSALQYLVLHWYWPEFGLMGFGGHPRLRLGGLAVPPGSGAHSAVHLGVHPRQAAAAAEGAPGGREQAGLGAGRHPDRLDSSPGFALGIPLLNILCLGTLLRQVHQRPGDAMGPGTAVRRPARREEAGSGSTRPFSC